ncbi:MAG: hypothetical protein V1698_00015 [bacterium]
MGIPRKLVDYINQLDTEGIQSFGQSEFPTLSDVFSGMLLVTRDPVEQLHQGIRILWLILAAGILDPFRSLSALDAFKEYAEAKAENNRQIASAVGNTRWDETTSGMKLGVLETKFFGAPGALYGAGAQVVVILNPDLNGVRKFTIAGNNGIRVDAVATLLNEKEPGWGGPPTGTIIGSPREGSVLSLEEVVEIVRATL